MISVSSLAWPQGPEWAVPAQLSGLILHHCPLPLYALATLVFLFLKHQTSFSTLALSGPLLEWSSGLGMAASFSWSIISSVGPPLIVTSPWALPHPLLL